MAQAGTMRAAFYEGAGAFRTGTLPIPTPAADEALLRVRRVGICGTDLHIFQGHLDHRVSRGGIIGHETFAEVAEAPVGSGFQEGDRVVVEPLRFCGTCRAWVYRTVPVFPWPVSLARAPESVTPGGC